MLLTFTETMHAMSSFEQNPSQAGPELRCCIDEALKNIPKQEHKHTPAFLGATAGMRLLRWVKECFESDVLLCSQQIDVVTH